MHVFRSRVDMWVAAIIAVTDLAVIYVLVALAVSQLRDRAPLGVLVGVALLVIGFSLTTLFSTYYTVERGNLSIRSGPFRWVVPIAAIEYLRPSRSLVSAPALSLDRLQIHYRKDGGGNADILISPMRQEVFIETLRAWNPRIELRD